MMIQLKNYNLKKYIKNDNYTETKINDFISKSFSLQL